MGIGLFFLLTLWSSAGVQVTVTVIGTETSNQNKQLYKLFFPSKGSILFYILSDGPSHLPGLGIQQLL
jgi:hypothetical protein